MSISQKLPKQIDIKIGHLYSCNFGFYKKKRSMVVVVGKHRGIYLVVPIETIKKAQKEAVPKGLHTRLVADDLPITHKYILDEATWAKSNLVSAVDGGHLTYLYDDDKKIYINSHKISDTSLQNIRQGIVLAIGMGELLA